MRKKRESLVWLLLLLDHRDLLPRSIARAFGHVGAVTQNENLHKKLITMLSLKKVGPKINRMNLRKRLNFKVDTVKVNCLKHILFLLMFMNLKYGQKRAIFSTLG